MRRDRGRDMKAEHRGRDALVICVLNVDILFKRLRLSRKKDHNSKKQGNQMQILFCVSSTQFPEVLHCESLRSIPKVLDCRGEALLRLLGLKARTF